MLNQIQDKLNYRAKALKSNDEALVLLSEAQIRYDAAKTKYDKDTALVNKFEAVYETVMNALDDQIDSFKTSTEEANNKTKTLNEESSKLEALNASRSKIVSKIVNLQSEDILKMNDQDIINILSIVEINLTEDETIKEPNINPTVEEHKTAKDIIDEVQKHINDAKNFIEQDKEIENITAKAKADLPKYVNSLEMTFENSPSNKNDTLPFDPKFPNYYPGREWFKDNLEGLMYPALRNKFSDQTFETLINYIENPPKNSKSRNELEKLKLYEGLKANCADVLTLAQINHLNSKTAKTVNWSSENILEGVEIPTGGIVLSSKPFQVIVARLNSMQTQPQSDVAEFLLKQHKEMFSSIMIKTLDDMVIAF